MTKSTMSAPDPIDRVELVRNPVLTFGRAHALAMVSAGERGLRVTGEAVRWLAWPCELGAGWHLVFVGWTSRADDAQARGYSKHFPHRAALMEIIGVIKLGAFTKLSKGEIRGQVEHAVVDSVIAWPPIPSQCPPGTHGIWTRVGCCTRRARASSCWPASPVRPSRTRGSSSTPRAR